MLVSEEEKAIYEKYMREWESRGFTHILMSPQYRRLIGNKGKKSVLHGYRLFFTFEKEKYQVESEKKDFKEALEDLDKQIRSEFNVH